MNTNAPRSTTGLPTCGGCGSTVALGNYHSCKPVESPKGWQCPLCDTVYSPTVTTCDNAHGPVPGPPQIARVVIAPGRCSGEPTVGDSRIPVDMVAELYWQHGMGQAEQQWEPYVDRSGVLLACWYMARYGSRTWRKRWAEWREIADYELWHSDPERWANCPEPPTASDLSQLNPT